MNTATWKLRSEQRDAYDKINGHNRAIINMPTGSGKSLLIDVVCAERLLEDPRRKVIICVPQRVIAKGFKLRMRLELPNGQTFDWTVPRNLCAKTPEKVAQLVSFIQRPAKGLPKNRIVLATHKNLACAFHKLNGDELKTVFSDTTLCIDEAHHIHASELGRNELGNVIGTILDLDDPSTHMLLATAYFFRGDNLRILSERHYASFVRHHLPFDAYWQALEHVKTYSYDFVVFSGTPWQELEKVLAHSSEPTIIYCPFEGHRLLLGKNKSQFVKRVVKLVAEHYGVTLWKPNKRPKGKVIVDLVDQTYRNEKIQFIEEHGDRVAAITTVGMFREGADWVQASRIIDLNPSGSDQDRLQRFGRLARDYPGKTHISYFSFFPFVVDQSAEERRQELSKLYAHFHASLVLHNAIRPVQLTALKRSEPNDTSKKRGPRMNCLGQLADNVQETIIRESFRELVKLADDKARNDQSIGPAEAQDAIIAVLKANGVETNLESMAKQVVLVMRRKSNITLSADELLKAGFDKVWSTEIFDGFIAFSASVGGPSTLAEIRKVIEKAFFGQWMDHYLEIRSLPISPSPQTRAYWWCTNNRVLYKNGQLSQDRIKLLEQIPWWRWTEGIVDRWQSMYQSLRSTISCPKSGTKEYAWVRHQRRTYEAGKLSNDRTTLLEQIPWWSWATNEKNWASVFDKLKRRTIQIDRNHPDCEWMRTQRRVHKRGKLSLERKQLLESLPGWSW